MTLITKEQFDNEFSELNPEMVQCYDFGSSLDDEDFEAWLNQPGGPDFTEDY